MKNQQKDSLGMSWTKPDVVHEHVTMIEFCYAVRTLPLEPIIRMLQTQDNLMALPHQGQ